jgi:hypothetical protein
MRTNSVSKAFIRLVTQNMLGLTDRMLVIGGGAADAELLQSLGFKDVTLLNINAELNSRSLAINSSKAMHTRWRLTTKNSMRRLQVTVCIIADRRTVYLPKCTVSRVRR